MIGTVIWAVYYDALQPNPGLTSHPLAQTYEVPSATAPGGKRVVPVPAVAGLPVDQHLGNLEGKEMRFGTSAGATFAALTVDVTDGAVNAEHDSLNPIAALSPMVGMWLNCIFGGKGVGMINMLLYMIIGIFVAGMMVGRTPEYLGKKIGGREAKLALIALLVHPLMILFPTGFFAATDWGLKAESNPGAHGFSQIAYQFSSASANNGSAFDGLGVTNGFANNPAPAPEAVPWDIVTGIVIIVSRFLPIIAPIAMAAYLGAKKSAPFGLGTLRDDTATFGFLLLGTVLIIGALLFLPVAALGPRARSRWPTARKLGSPRESFLARFPKARVRGRGRRRAWLVLRARREQRDQFPGAGRADRGRKRRWRRVVWRLGLQRGAHLGQGALLRAGADRHPLRDLRHLPVHLQRTVGGYPGNRRRVQHRRG